MRYTTCQFADCKNKSHTAKSAKCTEHRGNCLVDGCTNSTMRKNSSGDHSYCSMHKSRIIEKGSFGPVGYIDTHKQTTTYGQWRINGEGYRVRGVRRPYEKQTAELEHRVIAEQAIGRKLLPGENVHHINGDRADNRWPENLEIWNISQPPGQRAHEKIKFYTEFLRQYGFTVELADPEALGIDPNLLN